MSCTWQTFLLRFFLFVFPPRKIYNVEDCIRMLIKKEVELEGVLKFHFFLFNSYLIQFVYFHIFRKNQI